MSPRLSIPHVGALFLLAYGGGALVGVAVAWVNMNLRRRLDDPLLGNLVMILAPFTAYLLAELVHASGVLAVVVSGLIMTQVAPRIIRAEHRTQALAFWPLATFLIHGALFVLVGVELQYALRHLSRTQLGDALTAVGIVCLVLIAVRLAFLFASPYLIRLLDRRPKQRLLRVNNRTRVVSGLAGFRGAVSLAVALSVPQTLHSGEPFPDRDFIVFVTSGVILVTLVAQGLLLPVAVRWARLPADTSVDEEHNLAETTAVEEAIKAMPQLAVDLDTAPGIVEWLRQESEAYLVTVRARSAGADDSAPLCSSTSSTSRCAWPSSPTSAPPWSACATSAASTTPSCVACRPPSTPKRSASPAPDRRNDPCRTDPTATAASTLHNHQIHRGDQP